MSKRKNINYKLTAWQIAALENLVNDELGRNADVGSTPWVCSLQSLSETLERADQITVTKYVRGAIAKAGAP